MKLAIIEAAEAIKVESANTGSTEDRLAQQLIDAGYDYQTIEDIVSGKNTDVSAEDLENLILNLVTKDKKEEFEVEAALENEDELADLEGVENSN